MHNMKWQYFNCSLFFWGVSILLLSMIIVEQGNGQDYRIRVVPLEPTPEDSLEELLKYSNPAKVLMNFVSAETRLGHGGSSWDRRSDYVSYSELGWMKAKELDSIDSPDMECDVNIGKYNIIRDFQILPIIKMNDSVTIGNVVYDQVAVHFGDTIRISEKTNDTVTYRLKKRDGKWQVVDPPFQRKYIEIVYRWFDIEQRTKEHTNPGIGIPLPYVPDRMTMKEAESLWKYNLSVLDSIR
jgi:hypothetical protein